MEKFPHKHTGFGANYQCIRGSRQVLLFRSAVSVCSHSMQCNAMQCKVVPSNHNEPPSTAFRVTMLALRRAVFPSTVLTTPRRTASRSIITRATRLPFKSSSSSAPLQLPHRHWSGLQSWRDAPLNDHRTWGPHGPSLPASTATAFDDEDRPPPSPSSLAEYGSLVLSTPDPLAKSRLSHLAFSRYLLRGLPVGVSPPPHRPARPDRPALVSPKEIPEHKKSGLPLNAYMLHNLAHVELNAIDLAWDTVVRFSPMRDALGDEFFSDFARVADDESRHFAWCSQRLTELGFNYGDMPAHNLLWRECEKSSGDVAARLAVIPLVQEARGLDAGPRLVQKLVGFGDHRTSSIVAKIAEEEVAHVAVGVFWFMLLCEKLNRVPCATFKDLLKEYEVEIKGPFNYSAREEAGIPRDWYDGSSTHGSNSELSEVHDRLACIIAMEKENSSMNS